MTTFHFFPEKEPLLTWFTDSPDTGDPKCLCSYCSKVIGAGEMPLRAWKGESPKKVTELRLHMECARQVIVEMAPKKYSEHPTYAEGRAAQQNNVRRGANPYQTGADRAAWWAGWDDAWNKAHG